MDLNCVVLFKFKVSVRFYFAQLQFDLFRDCCDFLLLFFVLITNFLVVYAVWVVCGQILLQQKLTDIKKLVTKSSIHGIYFVIVCILEFVGVVDEIPVVSQIIVCTIPAGILVMGVVAN